MRCNDQVEIWSRFDNQWVRGFQLAAVVDQAGAARLYLVRRLSDGHMLPAAFDQSDVRPLQ